MGLNIFQLFMPCEVSLVLNLRGPNIVPRRPCVRRCQAFRHLPDKQNTEALRKFVETHFEAGARIYL